MRCAEEDDDGSDGEVDGEDPEAEPVDDHGRPLPVVRLLRRLRVVLHPPRDKPDLVEHRRQDLRPDRSVRFSVRSVALLRELRATANTQVRLYPDAMLDKRKCLNPSVFFLCKNYLKGYVESITPSLV